MPHSLEEIEREKGVKVIFIRIDLLATKTLSSKKLSTTDSLINGSGGINLFCGHLEVLIYRHMIFFLFG